MSEHSTMEIKVCPSLTLYAPGGPLEVTSVRVAVTFHGDQLAELRLIFEVTHEAWLRVDAGRWFHLDEDARGPIFGGGFHADKPVEIEATLRTQSLPLVAISAEDVWEIGAMFLDAAPGAEILSTEVWFALYVKQEAFPGLKTGMQTRWANAG